MFCSCRGWSGALYEFCPVSKICSKVKSKGKPPIPRAGHAGVVLDSDWLVIFGGRGNQSQRLNDTFVLCLKSMEWKIVNPVNKPEGRSLHSLTKIDSHRWDIWSSPWNTFLSCLKLIRALMYGGINSMCQPLNDGWIFDIRTLEWQELDLPYDHGEIRCWHGAALSNDGEMLIHSGLTQVTNTKA